MANLQIEVDKIKDLTTIHASGSLTADDISNAISSYYKDPTRLVLWDTMNSQLNDLSAVDLEKASKLISQLTTVQSDGKTAFVIPEDNFSLGVLFEGFSKIENLPREYRTFTSLEHAMRWLEQSYEPKQ